MYFHLKESRISDWWVAKSNHKMAFVNILSGGPLSEDLLVVGYLDGQEIDELATSTNRVVKVTKDGVITSQGTFYPFEKAHELYLQFLIDANEGNTLIATNWEYAKRTNSRIITADIIRDDTIERGVTFDFTPDPKYDVMYSGYSEKLSSNIILTTFARRNVCIALCIPKSVKDDIYRSSFAYENETIEKIKLIQGIFARKFK